MSEVIVIDDLIGSEYEKDKKKRKKCLSNTSINAETRIILFVITCMEWQAEYRKPAEFDKFVADNSLSRAIKAQLRDFQQDVKPFQYKNIYKK